MKVIKIDEEPNPQGLPLCRILVERNGKKYTFGARKRDYLDKRKRKSIQQTWIRTIKDREEEEEIKKDPKKVKKEADTLIQLSSEEIEEDPYD